MSNDINRQCSKTMMQVDRLSIIKQGFDTADKLRSLFLDDAFQLKDCLSRERRVNGTTTDTMEFVARCSEGSCLQSKRIVEIWRLRRRFGADIVQLLIILRIGEMNLLRGDANEWAYPVIN